MSHFIFKMPGRHWRSIIVWLSDLTLNEQVHHLFCFKVKKTSKTRTVQSCKICWFLLFNWPVFSFRWQDWPWVTDLWHKMAIPKNCMPANTWQLLLFDWLVRAFVKQLQNFDHLLNYSNSTGKLLQHFTGVCDFCT